MQALALVVHVALAIGVIGLVLIQHGKGADAGAAFGSGASSTVFGARGSASFLTRVTTGLAAAFFATSLFLFYLAAHRDGGASSVTDSLRLRSLMKLKPPLNRIRKFQPHLPANRPIKAVIRNFPKQTLTEPARILAYKL